MNQRITIQQFQSTPPVAGGRCRSRQADDLLLQGFNPRPPLPGGDAIDHLLSVGDGKTVVSIHAPRCRGAMRDPGRRPTRHRRRFNPRPPLPGGDASVHGDIHRHGFCFNPRPPLPGGDALSWSLPIIKTHVVSIHAPRCRGAMRGLAGDGSFYAKVSIHAPRCRGAMPD